MGYENDKGVISSYGGHESLAAAMRELEALIQTAGVVSIWLRDPTERVVMEWAR